MGDQADARSDVRGYVAAGFEQVAEVFGSAAAASGELGAGVCLSLEGETVVDLAWGEADAGLWSSKTLVPVLSASKAAVAVVAIVLADRGLLDIDAPVSAYWPDFARNRKQTVLVRHVLEHTSGVRTFEGANAFAGPGNRQLVDADTVARHLERAAPQWEPGTRGGYHALTFGWIMGELVRRIDGRTIGAFFADEVACPLGLDVFIGLPQQVASKVTNLLPPTEPTATLDAVGRAVQFLPDDREDADEWICEVVNDPYIRSRELPGVNGIASAAGLCGMYTPLANGGVGGRARVATAATLARFATPGKLPDGSRHGYGLGLTVSPLLNPPSGVEGIGHGGAGGFRGVADPGRRLAYAYVKNQMLPPRLLAPARAPSLAVIAAACTLLDRR